MSEEFTSRLGATSGHETPKTLTTRYRTLLDEEEFNAYKNEIEYPPVMGLGTRVRQMVSFANRPESYPCLIAHNLVGSLTVEFTIVHLMDALSLLAITPIESLRKVPIEWLDAAHIKPWREGYRDQWIERAQKVQEESK